MRTLISRKAQGLSPMCQSECQVSTLRNPGSVKEDIMHLTIWMFCWAALDWKFTKVAQKALRYLRVSLPWLVVMSSRLLWGSATSWGTSKSHPEVVALRQSNARKVWIPVDSMLKESAGSSKSGPVAALWMARPCLVEKSPLQPQGWEVSELELIHLHACVGMNKWLKHEPHNVEQCAIQVTILSFALPLLLTQRLSVCVDASMHPHQDLWGTPDPPFHCCWVSLHEAGFAFCLVCCHFKLCFVVLFQLMQNWFVAHAKLPIKSSTDQSVGQSLQSFL